MKSLTSGRILKISVKIDNVRIFVLPFSVACLSVVSVGRSYLLLVVECRLSCVDCWLWGVTVSLLLVPGCQVSGGAHFFYFRCPAVVVCHCQIQVLYMSVHSKNDGIVRVVVR